MWIVIVRPRLGMRAHLRSSLLAHGLAALLALVVTAAHAQEGSGPMPDSQTTPRAYDTSGAAYVSEAIAVPANHRDRFVECLRAVAKPLWARLRDQGLLADVSVFETTEVRSSAAGVPGWNFLIVSHLRPRVDPREFFTMAGDEPHSSTARQCTAELGVEVRRVEVLRPTPKSSYPRTTEADDTEVRTRKVRFIVEYIAVDERPAALSQYRESMGENMGPAMGLMIPEKTYFQLIALETESVKYSQKGLPPWNQIHIRGFYPEKGAAPAEMPVALRRVNPSAGGEFFASLDKIRTKPREDEARQLYDLAIR